MMFFYNFGFGELREINFRGKDLSDNRIRNIKTVISTFHIFRSSWFTIDLGVNLIPTAYTFRHSRGYGR